ncbi:MAG: hypothetical protein IFK94_14850, partial [Acidobacteria bacterium]|nr:hypothetical protein [Candidatus Polarisedimenticola svalbardensis]
MKFRVMVSISVMAVGLVFAGSSGERSGHQETPRDKHLPSPVQVDTPGTDATYTRNGYVSVQVNVDGAGLNIVGDAANEPSIAVDPTDPTRIAIGWRQFDNVLSDFRQAGYAYTTDGGHTWTFPGRIETGIFRSDPVLNSDGDGNFFYNSLTADGGSTNFRCHVFKSVDGGATWDSGVYAYGGDKQWQIIDQTDGIGRGNIYAAWNSSFSACSGNFTRSYDNGLTFTPCSTVAGNPYWGTLDVGPDGELYVSGTGMTIAKSTTMQDSGLSAAWDFSGSVDLGGSLVISAGPNPAGLLGQNWVAVDHSDGPTRGNVYMLASVAPNASADPLDVMFSSSTDGGTSWSTPKRLNTDPGTSAWQWFGTMSVAPNGRIDAVWLDTRNAIGGYFSELYYSFSTDAGLTWSPEEAVSPAFDPHIGWPQQDKMGDYLHMVSDEFGANLAYAATLNGEQDVYFVRLGDPACPDDGRVRLDRPHYACDGTVEVTVLDCGLNTDDETAETVVVSIDSESETGIETVTLTETSPTSARFQGAINLGEIDAPGVLLITEGNTVTVTYLDADDGAGGMNVPVTAVATVDCTPPLISGVQAGNIEPRSADVSFITDEPASGAVNYGTSCGQLTDTSSSNIFSTSPTVSIFGLIDNTTYYYSVEAEDEAGNLASDDNGGACYTFTTPEIPDFFTELFTGDNDTDFLRLQFTPNGSPDFYDSCVTTISGFPTDPTGGTALTLTDDSFGTVNLTPGNTVSLYGVAYNTFYVGSNGFITFNSGSSDTSETLEEHFNQPRISALYDDLNPASAGTVSWKELPDRVVVTYDGVTEYSQTNTNDFQIEMFFSGAITINYLTVDVTDGLAGLSSGNGLSPDFLETDLSAMAACLVGTCLDGILNQDEERIDCGGDCPPCQCLSDTECDDGLFCTGTNSCDDYGRCVAGSDPCPGESCHEGGDTCVECLDNTACDDGLFCNGEEACHGNVCRPGLAPCPFGLCEEGVDACAVCDIDSVCEPGEDCSNCPGDCISGSIPVCGNGVCEVPDGEDCISCPDDCNGDQQGKPSTQYCCGDGLTGTNPVGCADLRCNDGGNTCAVDPILAYCCGDATCNEIETAGNCPADCTVTVPGEAGAGALLQVTAYDPASELL